MEDPKNDQGKADKPNQKGVGVPYPVETIDEMLEYARELVEEYGSSRPISKEEISRKLNRSVNTLSLFFSTMGQYGLFTLQHGRGYLPSDLYRKYTEPVHENDEYKAKLVMFKSAPLYAKIIENINGHQLPADEKRFANLLKGDPYNVNVNSAEKASKIFFENCRLLNLRDSSGRFRFSDPNGAIETKPKDQEHQKETAQGKPSAAFNEDLFDLPIPLSGKRTAYLRYPRETLTRKDINVILKAVEFIASPLDDE